MQFEVGSIGLIEKFVQRGLALGLVPARIAAGFKGIAAVPVCYAPVRHLYAIWSTTPTPAARAFVQLLEQNLAARASH